MNILFLTLLYPEETKVQTAAASRDGLQNQIDNYQRAFVRGIRENLRKGESLELVNSLPVGIFPLRYRKLWLRGGRRNGNIRELPGLNLPGMGRGKRNPSLGKAKPRKSDAAGLHALRTLYEGHSPGQAPLPGSEGGGNRYRPAQPVGASFLP